MRRKSDSRFFLINFQEIKGQGFSQFIQSSKICFSYIQFVNLVIRPFRLIKHTEKLLEEKEEKLCVKILNTLGEMMKVDLEYVEKVSDPFSVATRGLNSNFSDQVLKKGPD